MEKVKIYSYILKPSTLICESTEATVTDNFYITEKRLPLLFTKRTSKSDIPSIRYQYDRVEFTLLETHTEDELKALFKEQIEEGIKELEEKINFRRNLINEVMEY